MTIDRRRLRHAIADEQVRRELLADPAIRSEYERLEPRFELIHAIVDARRARGWTQTDLATACCASQSAIARLESGDHDPRWSTAVRACRALGLDVVVSVSPAAVDIPAV